MIQFTGVHAEIVSLCILAAVYLSLRGILWERVAVPPPGAHQLTARRLVASKYRCACWSRRRCQRRSLPKSRRVAVVCCPFLVAGGLADQAAPRGAGARASVAVVIVCFVGATRNRAASIICFSFHNLFSFLKCQQRIMGVHVLT